MWIDCVGENPADRENLGPVLYHPTRGISANYFPYLNQEGYLSPAIFVEFTKPKRTLSSVSDQEKRQLVLNLIQRERVGLEGWDFLP